MDKTESITSKATGMSRSQANEASAGRGKMRTILGSQMIRQLILE